MDARFLIFVIGIVLLLWLSSNSFEVGVVDITLMVFVVAVAVGIWFIVRGLGGK